MIIADAYWTPNVNMLWIICDCGALILHRSNVATVRCGACNAKQLWHEWGRGTEPMERKP